MLDEYESGEVLAVSLCVMVKVASGVDVASLAAG
jgi:hypothetical protein